MPRALEPVGPTGNDAAHVGCGRARPPVAGVPRLARRPARVRPRARVDVRPDRQLLQALSARVVGADRARVERRQPHVRLPRRRPRPVVPARVAHPRRRREPLPRVRGHDRGRPARHRARHRAVARASTATRTRPTSSPAFRRASPRRPTRSRTRRSRPTRSAPTCTTICSTPPARSWRTSTARSPTGNGAATSTNGEPTRASVGRGHRAPPRRARPLAALARDRVARGYLDAVARAGAWPVLVDPRRRPERAPRPLRRARAHRRSRSRSRDVRPGAAPEDLRRRTAPSTTSSSRSPTTRSPASCRRSRSAAASRCSTSRSAARCTSTSPTTRASSRTAGPASPTAAAPRKSTIEPGPLLAKVMGTTRPVGDLPPPPGGRTRSATVCASSARADDGIVEGARARRPAAGSSRCSGTPRTPPRRPREPAPLRRPRSRTGVTQPTAAVGCSRRSRRSGDGGAELVLGDLAARVAGHRRR